MDPFLQLRPTRTVTTNQRPHGRRSTLLRQGVLPQDKNSRLKRSLSRIEPATGGGGGRAGAGSTAQFSAEMVRRFGFAPAEGTSRLGEMRAAGQHLIIHNREGARIPFLCLLDGKMSRHDNPFYDVTLDVKWSKPASASAPIVVFGYSNASADYFSIRGDYDKKTWALRQHIATGSENGFMHHVRLLITAPHTPPAPGRSVKHPNIFRSLFIQVRGASLSLDVDGYPIFTSHTLPIGPLTSCNNTNLGTSVGVACAPGSSWIFRSCIVQPKAVLKAVVARNLQLNTQRQQDAPPPPTPSINALFTPAPVPVCSQYLNLGDPHLIRLIEEDMLEIEKGSPNAISFHDIAGLDTAKRLLNEAVILPSLAPEVFVGIRESWKGVLMFGPPGTGKTMLARAAAASSGIAFISTSAATLVSKYRGESCKLVRTLFAVARARAPSCIFIDEIDALATRRGGPQEHEASRRLKSELLTCMDGIASASGDRVVVMATTNTPWDLNEALLRRLEKRILVPLPDRAARQQLLTILMKGLMLAPDITSVEPLVTRLEGYSCADIRMVVREAGMGPVRRLLEGKSGKDIAQMRADGSLSNPGPVTLQDIVRALKSTHSSVAPEASRRFASWGRQFAST